MDVCILCMYLYIHIETQLERRIDRKICEYLYLIYLSIDRSSISLSLLSLYSLSLLSLLSLSSLSRSLSRSRSLSPLSLSLSLSLYLSLSLSLHFLTVQCRSIHPS